MTTSISVPLTNVNQGDWEFYSDDPNLRGGSTPRADSDSVEASRTATGLIFPSVAIPQGRKIITAIVKIQATTTGDDDINVSLEAQDVDDAPSFATEAFVITRTPKTTATVDWIANSLGASYVNSPSIVTIIQEIVDRGGWVSGNDLMILFLGKNDISKRLTMEGGNQVGEEPTLEVTFSSARMGVTVIL